MKFKSYSKLNLALLITGKRSNGFHELYSIFQEIDLYDEITIKENGDGSKITLSSNLKNFPLNHTNTIYKAAALLMPLINKNLVIHVHKNIPSEAGLGGGSANAASTLLALDQMFTLHLPPKKILELADKVGADVPFFIEGNQALVTGRGEILKEIFFTFPYHIVLLKPTNFKCSTQEIFKNYAEFLNHPVDKKAVDTFIKKPTIENLKKLENHLERPLINKYPIIAQMKKDLIEQGAFFSMMTGSGSVVFGLFEKKPKIKKNDAYQIYYTTARN